MIKEHCLKGVDEVYGFHNIPQFDEGDIRVCEGPFFAAITEVRIRVKGQGGHGSSPHRVRDVITAGCQIHQALHSIMSRNICSRKNFVFTICNFHAGNLGANTVFPDQAIMEGSIRWYD